MNITNEQKCLLETFRCERLSSDDANIRLIDNFYNRENQQLVKSLQNEAYEEDINNSIAYYVIKSKNDNIVFFFSLKCGLLYDKFIEGEQLEEMKKFYNHILTISKDNSISKDDQETIDIILEKARTKKALKKEEVARVLKMEVKDNEFSKLFDDNLKSVGSTYSGVELVHFCANDKYREEWNDCHFPQKMGTIIFWQFIVKKIQNLMEIVGCEYFFLYAADKSEDEILINYYEDQLGFKRNDGHCAAIPMYDFTCRFMSQETIGLEKKRKQFFNTFNPDNAV